MPQTWTYALMYSYVDRDAVRKMVEAIDLRVVKPRVHPNGFIQLDVERDMRLHVWPDRDDIPCQSVSTPVHDHKFDMKSTVLRGQLTQYVYLVKLDPQAMDFTHHVYLARPSKGTEESTLQFTGVQVTLVPFGERVVKEGESYSQMRYTFHETSWDGLTATLVEKRYNDDDHDPRVLVPIGAKPDNTFVRSEVSEELLWDYIWRALT